VGTPSDLKEHIMNTSATALSTELERAVVDTLGLLERVSDALRRPRPAGVDEYTHLRFEGLVLLASHRGRHLVDVDDQSAAGTDRSGDLEHLLRAAHSQLADELIGLEDFEVLEFVAEVGAICREVTTHVHAH
jgi:hypothetical protein